MDDLSVVHYVCNPRTWESETGEQTRVQGQGQFRLQKKFQGSKTLEKCWGHGSVGKNAYKFTPNMK